MQRPAFLADVEFTPRKIITGVLVLLGLIALTLLYRQIDVEALHRRAENLNGLMIFVLMTLLPLTGFVAYAIFITVATAFAFRRLQARMKDPPPAAGDQKQPA